MSQGSLPMRERGLKQKYAREESERFDVAPHAGAWIETRVNTSSQNVRFVAPHAGAWIETKNLGATFYVYLVAPHAGAWIETLDRLNKSYQKLSLPMRERGLKQNNVGIPLT